MFLDKFALGQQNLGLKGLLLLHWTHKTSLDLSLSFFNLIIYLFYGDMSCYIVPDINLAHMNALMVLKST
jgi:hypothetical protein